jgi:hypothetical protein
VLFEQSHAFRDGRLQAEVAGRHRWRFTAGGRPRDGLSVGGSEHLTLPALAPSLRDVGVHLAWFGSLTPVAHRLAPLSGLAARLPGAGALAQRATEVLGRRLGEAPSDATVASASTRTVAEVRDSVGELVSRVELGGPEAYGLTAQLLAWGATCAADGGVAGSGALGPVQAFGLQTLTDGAAEAGLRRA